MINNIFIQLAILFGITISVAFIMRLLRQPLMSAYIVAGIIAGPLWLNLLHGDSETYQAFSQFGVVLLLFVVGLSLNLNHLKQIGKVAITTGFAQVLLTASAGFFILRYLGFSAVSAFYLGVGITFSSTVIIVKLLNEKKESESTYGRYAYGLMLVQDVIATGILLVITSFGEFNVSPLNSLGILVIKGIILLSVGYFLTKLLLKKILNQVAQSGEFLFIFTVAWCFGVASLLYWAGFPLEIGAIVAGLSLGSSSYQAEIASRIKPLRDFFIVLFFIILGSEMGLTSLGKDLFPGIILSTFVLIVNPLILYFLYRWQKFSRRNSFLLATTAAQVSEFGFILIFTGIKVGHLSGSEMSVYTIVALITIFVSSYLINYNEQIYRFLIPFFKLFGPDKWVQKEENGRKFEVFLFGYHRIGWKICEFLLEKKITFAVIDFNPETITKLKRKGISAFYGDASDIEFLSSLPLKNAKLIISTLPTAEDQLVLVQFAKGLSSNKKPFVILNLYHNSRLSDLYEAGADYVMMPHLLGGHWMVEVLKSSVWGEKTFKKLKNEQKEEMKMRFTAGTQH